MIRREILNNPEAHIDFFGDFQNTIGWLKSIEGTEKIQERLLERYNEWYDIFSEEIERKVNG